jgi:glycosyltransferase involved in cell wall biosynthesis/peptidoglycan/xylan/chitin deacetylase (PgdA/CDA1 family)
MPSEILFIVNSVFGARKAPGFRPYQLVRFGTCRPRVIARGAAVAYGPSHFPLPGRSLIPRALNFMRIKLLPKLPAREIEQGLFDRLCLWRSQLLRDTPRLVHLWDHLPLTAAYWKGRGVPVLLDLHMAHPRCYRPLVEAGRIEAASVGSLEDPAADRCIALADLLVCPSQFVYESLREADRARAVVIPFGADPVPDRPPRAGGRGPVRVLFAGNVNRRKGVPFLLAAWRALALPPEQAELVLCGRQFAEAADWVRTAPPGVRFAGFQADMAPAFADAEIFVLPSLMEGSAKAVYEAMACGLPAIVTPHTGSVVKDGEDGLVVPAADVGALAAALGRLIADRPLRERLGAAARRTAQGYSWEVYARAVAGLYRRWPVPAATASEVAPDAAMTYFDHVAPRPLVSKLRMLADQGRLALKAVPRRVDTTGTWLRFPFYHHVFDDERRGFARHLDTMRNYGEFIGLDDAVRLLEDGTPLEGRYLCLSFDDGFRCGLTHALPILAERSVPAAFFVVSGLVPDRSDHCTPEHRHFFGPGRRPVPFLTWDDCRTLLAAGMTIGSHSAGHRRLIGLDDAGARDELALSKAAIEAALGRRCDHFCCPWGKPGRDFQVGRDPELARALGYRSFLTTKYGAMRPGESPFAIRRVGLVARFGTYQLRYFLSL